MRSMCMSAAAMLVVVVSGCATGGDQVDDKGSSAGSGSAGADQTDMQKNAISHQVSEVDLAGAKKKEAVAADEVVLWVSGMGCPLCATNIDKQLERLSSVKSVDVDLGTGKVRVGMLAGKPHPSPARFGEAVEDAGFTLVKVEEIVSGS
jgi:copper chaperone CopZ